MPGTDEPSDAPAAAHAEVAAAWAWPRGGAGWGSASRPGPPACEPKDARGQPRRKTETFSPRLDNVGWITDRPSHVYVVRADGTDGPRNLTPGPYQHHGVA